MEFNVIQIVLVFIVSFICAIDQFSFLESLYQPIVTGLVIGAILGDVKTGLVVGGTYQLMTIGNMPIGGAQPPNAVVGGIVAPVLAISSHLDAGAAVGLAIPFALLGQYGITLLFTIMSPLMSKADEFAQDANPGGIVGLNYFAMALLGLIFGAVVTGLFVGGNAFGPTLAAAIPAWLSGGLSMAGTMMRFVGFAILLKVMMTGSDYWGFLLMGFGMAIIIMGIPELRTPALFILALIGFGFAFWDYQHSTALAASSAVAVDGGDEDGI